MCVCVPLVCLFYLGVWVLPWCVCVTLVCVCVLPWCVCVCYLGVCVSIHRCIVENGQCDCRRHLIGRQCTEVQSGYFCSSLDFYTYEAETASGHSPDDPDLPVGVCVCV